MQAEVLLQASQMEAGDLPDERDEFTRQQLRRASELVKGAAALGAIENSACLGILSRSLLEQLITSLWGAVAGAECNTVIELKPEHHAALPWHFA